jgi:hypothetical protein
MILLYRIVVGAFAVLFLIHWIKAWRLSKKLATKESELAATKAEAASIRTRFEAGFAAAQNQLDEHLAAVERESERIRKHYEAEASRISIEAHAALAESATRHEAIKKYEKMLQAEADTARIVEAAIASAQALRHEAEIALEAARRVAVQEKSQAVEKAKEIRFQADALLDRATRDAGRIVEEAHKQAAQIGGDGYTALRDKERLEQAAAAIRNVVEGYGARYLVPTRSVIDDLALSFGHTEAGQSLVAAREQSQRMVEEGQAAACDYAEANRRETAVRFAVAAFNGRVDAILSRTRTDNYGTLEQEIKDAFSLVNLNGAAFRNARILDSYRDARLAELKWSVVAQELREKEREEQRQIKEQMREEEKARRDFERAMKEAQQQEEVIKKALVKAQLEADVATAEQRSKYEHQIAELSAKLVEAEAKNQRAISMAQQTRKGNVYIISNLGSFGEEVFKIGMTRRLEAMLPCLSILTYMRSFQARMRLRWKVLFTVSWKNIG